MLLSDLTDTQMIMLVLPALPNMWALSHAMKHDFPTSREKYRWMLACVFLPCVAGLAYFFVGRRHVVGVRPLADRNDGGACGDGAASGAQACTAGPASRESDSVFPAAVEAPPSHVERKGAAQLGEQGQGDRWSFGCPSEKKRG